MMRLLATMLLAAASAAPAAAGPASEAPAAPERLVVTLQAGARWTGAPARLDVRMRDDGSAPRVELALSAADGQGRHWAVVADAGPGFDGARELVLQVTDRPLATGQASVQRHGETGAAERARGGVLRLQLQHGRIRGTATGVGDRLAARFEGPVAVSCAVPPSALAAAPAAPASPDMPAPLVVDEQFVSAACRPFAELAARR